MEPESDPRVYFAAERTLLAWLRTGIAMIGLGFLIGRFGVFLAVVRGQGIEASHVASNIIGLVLVLLGTFMIAGAAWQHREFVRTSPGSFPPTRRWPALGLWVAVLVAIAGAALAVFLVFSLAQESQAPTADAPRPNLQAPPL